MWDAGGGAMAKARLQHRPDRSGRGRLDDTTCRAWVGRAHAAVWPAGGGLLHQALRMVQCCGPYHH